ncbi:Polysaccharide pyruvyl transferase [Microbacterium sp. cf046]|nr:Polysaccharide pyruvyl transferase [Microbacterium sp. cf046]
MWRSGVVVPTYWWDGHPNFGDAMTSWLLPTYGVLPVHRVASRARLAGVGSVLEFLPDDFDGAIWGSGLIRDEPHPLPRAHALAVRGPLSRERIGAADAVALGDPGILVSRHLRRPAPKWDVGLVPHGHHRSHERFLALADAAGSRVRVVDVHQEAASAVREIAACGLIVTTSLHGLVTADSFGIPAVWTTLDPPLEGGDFKFRDYEAALPGTSSRFIAYDEDWTLDALRDAARTADADDVVRMGDALVRSLDGLRGAVGPLPRFPIGAVSAFRR